VGGGGDGSEDDWFTTCVTTDFHSRGGAFLVRGVSSSDELRAKHTILRLCGCTVVLLKGLTILRRHFPRGDGGETWTCIFPATQKD
jgi:hypothetical protein